MLIDVNGLPISGEDNLFDLITSSMKSIFIRLKQYIHHAIGESEIHIC